ncbi:hypothetical protein C8034_v006093 [Colletotrichum sidae]|uniref:Uncharacterized protein n=1 Tax=Colletotrichum sidae TaxID=1347389 RepID=A0A4R8TT92_9PEZI|nr:hypothetical protein C8034_v006093 [Colletotrichum sidae]
MEMTGQDMLAAFTGSSKFLSPNNACCGPMGDHRPRDEGSWHKTHHDEKGHRSRLWPHFTLHRMGDGGAHVLQMQGMNRLV